MKFLYILLLFSTMVHADKSIETLLKIYKDESELSKITKKDSAGFVSIYTRDDLEKMQARTLGDVFKTLTNVIYTRTPNSTSIFEYPTQSYSPLSLFRLYINDHDVTSSSFGSALLIWSDMPIDEIDHIEIYSGSSSIEFGNEAGSVIIKLYTKDIYREEGGKAKIMFDNKGSYSVDTYFAHTTQNDLSYMFYANKDNINRTKYYYQDHTIDSDKESYNLFANIIYQNLEIDLMRYAKDTGNFLGKANITETHQLTYLPNYGSLYAKQDYLHVKKKFINDTNLELSYDNFLYNRTYQSTALFYAGAAGLVKKYNTKYSDDIFSVKVDKKFRYKKHNLLLGAFYKYKKFNVSGTFDNLYTLSDNSLNIYSIYGEYRYNFDTNTLLLGSLRGDIYRYRKVINSQNKWIGKIGIIKNIDKFQIKTFYTKTYYALPFHYLYNADNIPFTANPTLKYPDLYISSLGIKYKNNNHEFNIKFMSNRLKNGITRLLKNSEKSTYYTTYEANYTYKTLQNKIILDFFTAHNNEEIEESPKYSASIRVFNTINKFDIYNELGFKSSYQYAGIEINKSYNYTFALKYHFNPDFNIGVKFENIFNKSFEQAYSFFPYSIPVYDKKIWFSAGYTF